MLDNLFSLSPSFPCFEASQSLLELDNMLAMPLEARFRSLLFVVIHSTPAMHDRVLCGLLLFDANRFVGNAPNNTIDFCNDCNVSTSLFFQCLSFGLLTLVPLDSARVVYASWLDRLRKMNKPVKTKPSAVAKMIVESSLDKKDYGSKSTGSSLDTRIQLQAQVSNSALVGKLLDSSRYFRFTNVFLVVGLAFGTAVNRSCHNMLLCIVKSVLHAWWLVVSFSLTFEGKFLRF